MKSFYKAKSNGAEVLETGDLPAGSHPNSKKNKNKNSRVANRQGRGAQSSNEHLYDILYLCSCCSQPLRFVAQSESARTFNLNRNESQRAHGETNTGKRILNWRRNSMLKSDNFHIGGIAVSDARKAIYAAIETSRYIPGTSQVCPTKFDRILQRFNEVTKSNIVFHCHYYPHAVTGTCYLDGVSPDYRPLAFMLLGVFPRWNHYSQYVVEALGKMDALLPVKLSDRGVMHVIYCPGSEFTLHDLPTGRVVGFDTADILGWLQLKPDDDGYCTDPYTCALRLCISWVWDNWYYFGIVFVASKFLHWVRSFPDGYCYRYLTPGVKIGANPLLSTYMAYSTKAAYGLDDVICQYDSKTDTVHIEPHHCGLPASVIHECLRRNVIVTHDGVHGPTDKTRIGTKSVFFIAGLLSLLMHTIAYVIVYACLGDDLFEHQDGRCYTCFIDADLGCTPQLTKVTKVNESNIKDVRIKIQKHGELLHAELDPAGISAKMFMESLKNGLVRYVNDDGCWDTIPAQLNMRIGGLEYDLLTHRPTIEFQSSADASSELILCSLLAVVCHFAIRYTLQIVDMWTIVISLMISFIAKDTRVTTILCLINAYISLQPVKTKAHVYLNVFGSAGDKRPLMMYKRLLESRGFSVDWIDHSPGFVGKFMLGQIESNDYSSALGLTALLYVRVVEQAITGGVVLSPLKAAFTGAIEYSVSPTPSKVAKFRLFVPGCFNWINECADLWFRNSGAPIRIDASRSNCPRSANGDTPIVRRTNKALRKRLIVMGSGSEPEPNLPLEGTWSTSCSSRYPHEPDTDHNVVFANYEEIHCHGGAGTVATAKACGCKVFSYSKLLDRDIVENEDYYFSNDTTTFLVQLAEGLSPRALRELWPYFGVSIWNYPQLYWIRFRKVCREIYDIGFVLAVFVVRATVITLRERSFEKLVYDLVSGSALPQLLSMLLAHCAVSMIRARVKRDGFLKSVKTAWHPANEFLWFVFDNNRSLVYATLVSRYGLLTTYLLYTVGATLIRLLICVLPDVTDLVFRWLDNMLERYYVEVQRDDVIQLRFQRMTAWWAKFLPLYHVEWFNPRTKESTGITVVDKRCAVYNKVNDIVPRQFVLPTSISIKQWESIKTSLNMYEGTLYHPANNCQTTALSLLKTYGEDPYLRVWLLFLCTVTCLVMTIMGVTVMQFGTVLVFLGFTTSYVDAMMPRIAFAAIGRLQIHSVTDLFNFLVSPSALLVDGPRIIDRWEKYPRPQPSTRQMNPTSLRTIRLNVGGEGRDYLPPLKGMNRPNYTYGRGGYYKYVHNITEDGLATRATTSQLGLVRQIADLVDRMELAGLVAVIATTEERPICETVWQWSKRNCDSIIILSNTPMNRDAHNIVLPASGRTLATLRLAMPEKMGVRWLSLNAILQTPAVYSLEKLTLLMPFLRKSQKTIGVSAHGLNPGPASGLVYSKPIMGEASIDFDIYGCEEWELTKHEMTVYVADTMIMLNAVRGQMDFQCKRHIVLYDANTMQDKCEFQIDWWSAKTIVDGLASSAKCRRSIGFTDKGAVVNDQPVNMAPIVSEMYPEGTRVEDVVVDITSNVGAFVSRVSAATIDLLSSAKSNPVAASVLRGYYQVCKAFDRKGRSPKGIWAPVHVELDKRRAESAGLNLHPNPVFIHANFNDTLSYYVKHLNALHDGPKLSVTEFRRRVNRSPYVDDYLREKLPDAYSLGVDASVLASRQLMLASLARYNKTGFVDALTDDDTERLVEAIYKRNPDMFDDAMVSDPYKLTKRFLSYKRYSAGLPFSYVGGISKRSDLRKAGWLKPMAELAKLSYETGEWYPAIAHAFPKSQVVSAEKIKKKPWKMRSIVATAGFNNVQQGLLNFDINNRHDFIGTHEKVAMPLNGSYMSYVYADCVRYKNVYSLDASDMDANISNGVFKVIAGLRKKGFENHPAYEAICKHIDCAIEQTKCSYVINLVADDACSLTQIPTEFIGVNEWAQQYDDKDFIESRYAPGKVLAKKFGGSTGDSNVTFNNTKAMPIILMYSYCKARNIPFTEFFNEVALHNFGDDDILATDAEPQLIQMVVDIAKKDLGITLTYESKGTNILDQVFLGRRPVSTELFLSEFKEAGVKPPQYAIVNDADTMKMRLAKEKAEMSRHKGMRHELYRLEKCMGYALLSAHNRGLYEEVKSYFDTVLSRIPESLRMQAWFKRKYKLIPYNDVLRKWYAPMNPDHFTGVHGLQLKMGLLAQTEAGFIAICRVLNWACDAFPSHLVQPDSTVNAIRVSELNIGIFEAHAWHTYVREFNQAPTLAELEARVRLSPFAQFTNCKFWFETIGAGLPTEGPQFERNANHAMMKLIVYTAVYVHTNALANILGAIPLGNVIADMLNLYLFKSRRLFGTLSYAHYIAKGRGNPNIDALVPKDPYAYHKRAAAIAMTCIPDMHFLAWIPTSLLSDITAKLLSVFATTSNFCITSDDGLANIPALAPWRDAVHEALQNTGTPMLVAPTGTGKTRFTPSVLLAQEGITQVIVVMPRNIICESWSHTSGALFKKKGVIKQSPLVTCTYGYLAHCVANDNIWWEPTAFFVFDEAHEESLEWLYLRREFVRRIPCMALTATPDAQTCAGFNRIDVDIEPVYRIETIQLGAGSLEFALETYLPSANRFLVIEPSLKRCRKLYDRLIATGYPVKVVHSGDRTIPDGVHIIATSVIEASITVPGCDVVIDTGERIVNDQGTIKRVPNTIPGAIQRKGRTGRTNHGLYIQIVQPKNVEYEPVPEVSMVLQGHPITSVIRLKNPLLKARKDRQLLDNQYAWITGKVPASVESVSLIHRLLLQNLPNHQLAMIYEQLRSGCAVDGFDHFITENISHNALVPFDNAMKMHEEAQIRYFVRGKAVGNRVSCKNGTLIASGETEGSEGGVQDQQLDTVVPTRSVLRKRRSKKKQVRQ